MNLLSFDEFVDQQTATLREAAPDAGIWLEEWKRHLESLYGKVETFLGKYLSEKKVRLSFEKKELNEEAIGRYEVRALTIQLGANQIHFEPIGTQLVSAKGRVDMTGPRGTVKLVLVDSRSSAPRILSRVFINGEKILPTEPAAPVAEWVWKIATSPPKVRYEELTLESFHQAIMEVVNG